MKYVILFSLQIFIGLTFLSFANHLKVQYEQRRFRIEEDDDRESIWQLFYPQHFISVSLHHVKEREKTRIEEVARSMSSGFSYNLNSSNTQIAHP